MSIPNQHAQEQLSRAYLQAVAAEARVEFQWSTETEYGIDGDFKRLVRNPRGKLCVTGYPLNFQLKSSINCNLQNGKVKYDLDVDTYNHLISYYEETKTICLIVYDMPNLPSKWVDCSHSELILRSRCYYWTPSGKTSNNLNTKRIKIDKGNTLTPRSLPDLIKRMTP